MFFIGYSSGSAKGQMVKMEHLSLEITGIVSCLSFQSFSMHKQLEIQIERQRDDKEGEREEIES